MDRHAIAVRLAEEDPQSVGTGPDRGDPTVKFDSPGQVPRRWENRWLDRMSRPESTEGKYRGLVRALPAAGIIFDAEGTFVELLANEYNQGLFYEAESLLGQTVFDVFPESTAERFHETIRRTVETNAVQTIDYELAVRDGVRQFEACVAPIPGENPSQVVWVAEDVTARVEPERWFARLTDVVTDPDRSFEAKLQALFDLGCERFDVEVGAVARVDPGRDQLEIEYASRREGYFSPGTELPLSETYCTAVIEGGGPASVTPALDELGAEYEDRTVHDDFGLKTYAGTHIAIEGNLDRTLFFVSTGPRARSLSEDERFFLELLGQWLKYELGREVSQERERRIEAVFDQTYQFTGLLEPDGAVVEANQTALEFGGLDREDVLGEKMWETGWFQHSEETRARARRAVQRAADGEFVRHELTVRGADGEAVIDFSVRPVTDEDGEVTLLIPEGRDITERKRHEERLESLHEASRRLWQADSEREIAAVTVDIAENVLDEHLVAMWSYDPEADKLVSLAATDAAKELDDVRTLDAEFGPIPAGTTEMCVFREGEQTIIRDYQTADAPAHPETSLGTVLLAPLGEYGQLHVGSRTVSSIEEETLEMISTLAKNAEAALERQAHEQELKRKNDQLTRTEELANVGGWELDLRTNTQTWTDGTRRIHEVADDFEPTLENGIEFYHPEDREVIEEAVERCRETGEPFNVEARLVTANGRERWVEATGEAVERDGEVVRLRGAIRDVTDRKEREQQLSVLYRILRHNLRNDLHVIQGFSSAVDRELDRLETPAAIDGREVEAFDRIVDQISDPSDDLERDIAALERVIAALSEMPVDEMHTYEEKIERVLEELMSIGDKASELHSLIVGDVTDQGCCQLDATLEAVVDGLREEYPDASIEVDDVEPRTVEGGPGKVALALRELLDNALRHAETETPVVEVRVTRAEAGEVTVEVVDRGPGIPDYELEALRQGKEETLVHGSGFGLWLVNWLATHLDGHLTFETNDPRGTIASLTLPVAGETVDPRGGGDDG